MGLETLKDEAHGFLTHAWNPIKEKDQEIILDEEEFKTDLGSGNYIFVGSGTDIFAPDVPSDWLYDVLIHMHKYPDNKYLIQSKNTMRMLWYEPKLPENTIFCTTIESNRDYPEISKAPNIAFRFGGIRKIKDSGRNVMITIEPVLDFDPLELSSMLIPLVPRQVNIGADSKNHGLPEPSKEKLEKLIGYFEQHKHIKLVLKPNLRRLMK